jgi:hypothetical protein
MHRVYKTPKVAGQPAGKPAANSGGTTAARYLPIGIGKVKSVMMFAELEII